MAKSETERAMWAAIRADMQGVPREPDGFIDPKHFSPDTRAKIDAYHVESMRARLQPAMTPEQVYDAWQERMRGEESGAFERMLEQLRYGLLVLDQEDAGRVLIKSAEHDVD